MRVLLDTFVWISLKEDEKFLKEFIELYRSTDMEILFSHGNFMDLAIRDEQDKLSRIIGMFADEYCGPVEFEEHGNAGRSEDPLILTKMHEDWHEYCVSELGDYGDSEKLQALFREGSFDPKPASSHMAETVKRLREWGEFQINGELRSSTDLPDEFIIKIFKSFPEYQKEENGTKVLELADVPLNIFVFRMSLVYISDTTHNPELGDFRDAIIWSQAILHECDVLWTETQWKYQHPVISRVMERIRGEFLSVVHDYEGFREQLDEGSI